MEAATTAVVTTAIETAGLSTNVHRAGARNARHLLLLHGGGPGADALSNWRHALPALSDAFDVLAPDLAGFGATTHPDPPLDGPLPWLQLRMRQVIDLLDALGIEQTDVVGNSLGGALSLHLVVNRPDRFRQVVLMGTAATPIPPTPELIELVTFYQRGTEESMAQMIRNFVARPDALGDDLAALAAARLKDALRDEVKRSYQAMFPPDPEAMRRIVVPDETVARIEHPVLLVHGREDKIIPLEASLYLLTRLRNVELHVFGDCGHWVQLECQGRFEQVVRDFLDGAAR